MATIIDIYSIDTSMQLAVRPVERFQTVIEQMNSGYAAGVYSRYLKTLLVRRV